MSTQDTAAAPSITESLVGALSDTWRAIQARHPDVPDVVLTLGSGTGGRRTATKWGHFAGRRWIRTVPAGAEETVGDEHQAQPEQHVHELFVGGEGLVRGPVEVLGTLLHEAAHALAEARGIADTSGGGRYHNLKFKQLAEQLGLAVTEAAARGWASTTVPEATAAAYEPQIDALAAAITAHRAPEPTRPAGTPATGRMLAAVCGCTPPRRFRIAKGVFDLGGITCNECDQQFTLTT